tara:strand:+ start:1739 stop:2050 length:312 start_codon:yes stop_codon:yes gene_type:complete
MLEIMTAISVCSQCVKGVERLVNRGAELEQCVGHLSRWFEAASDIKQREEEQKHPALWKKLTFQGSIESEALNLIVVKKNWLNRKRNYEKSFVIDTGLIPIAR